MSQKNAKQLTILLVNDDGPTSPLMLPFIEALSKCSICGELRVVLPAEERSWSAMSMTRLQPVYTNTTTLAEIPATLVTGTPADCAALGVATLFDSPPDLVVSGINMGTNASLPFFLSSGTVGGAILGSLSGIPSIAVSSKLVSDVYREWKNSDYGALAERRERWHAHASCAVQIIEALVEHGPHDCDLMTVNMPWEVVPGKSAVRLTSFEPLEFTSLFNTIRPGVYRHSFGGFRERSAGKRSTGYTDLDAEKDGAISVAPVRFTLEAPVEQSLETNLNKSLSLK